MNYTTYFKIILMFLIIQSGLKAQVSITNISIQPFNLTPEALLDVTIMNNGDEQQAHTLTQLFNSENVAILTVKSQVFTIRKGLNAGINGGRKLASSEFASSTQTDYLKTTHNLPGGKYRVCCLLFLQNGSIEVDDFCDEIDSDFNQYLYLVNPFDGDTIESKNPLLSWTNSEPFSALNQGEFYRMVVTEMKEGQSAEEAVTINTPVMVKNYLSDYHLQYPFDARELNDGAKYAWQVQKVINGIVINKTEAWVFILNKAKEAKAMKYVALKRQLDGSFYTAYNGIVYFKFSEEYKSQGELFYKLTNERSEVVKVSIIKDKQKESKSEQTLSVLKICGDNRYELNLNTKKMGIGFYTLEIKNEKNESFYLKIFLP